MTQPPISDILATATQPLLSYEFFPPKDGAGFELLHHVANELQPTRPDFVTVTYGAGGSTRDRTMRVCRELAAADLTPVMHHLTCVGASKADLCASIDAIYASGIRNIMALRGDPPQGETQFRKHQDGLEHAVDLVRLIKDQYPDICCGVAGYPETHQEASSSESDIQYLKEKLDAGASFVTTQLFYDNTKFFNFVSACRKSGIKAPIVPGLLPPTSLKQLRRMTSLCQASLPEQLVANMETCGEDNEKSLAVGIDWTVEQIRQLLDFGVPGIHLYILNRSKTALAPALMACFKR
jgi:methylenetetrahydrofolate reductase (NADPH)